MNGSEVMIAKMLGGQQLMTYATIRINTVYATGLLVKLRVYQAESPGSNAACGNFYTFLQTFFHCKPTLRTFVYLFFYYMDCFYVEARAKQYQSVRHCYMTFRVCKSATIVHILLQY